MSLQGIIKKNLHQKSIISFLLYPLSLFYALFMLIRRNVYAIFPSFVFYSEKNIISIGNITTGGSGKTPFTLFLANKLLKEDYKIAIVLRGYKGKYENDNVEVSSLNYLDAGDEAMMYYHNLPDVPIYVGKNRIKAIKKLEKKYPELDYIIMDDAFQHLKVHQDVKFCILNTLNTIGNGFCLPAGILREPLSVLKSADYIVFNGYETNNSCILKNKLNKLNKPILKGKYQISSIKDLNQNTVQLNDITNKKNILLSGIGTPQSFEKLVQTAGITFSKHIKLNDHFEYTKSFFQNLSDESETFDYIITTEKDFTKIKKFDVKLDILTVYIKFEMDLKTNITLKSII